MRVLHVLAERGFSGGEVQLRYLIRHLQARGHENRLVLCPGAEFAETARELGVPVSRVNLRRPSSPLTWTRMRAAVREARPEILHFGCGRSLLWGGWISRHVPAGVRVTTRRIDYPISPSWYRGGRYRRLVDHVVANCVSVQRRVLAVGVPAERVSMIHEGIEMAPWRGLRAGRSAARARLGIGDDRVVVNCAATLRPRKGQRELLAAFARVVPQHPSALLVLAGGGPDGPGLERRAGELGIAEHVRVPGPIRPVADLYAASDLGCMPSFNEGLSNACLEQSAAGLPLVVSDVGGLPEIVEDGVTGAVVPAGDVSALADALARYIADRSAREAAGAAGAERTPRLFTEARMTERMEELFDQLVTATHVRRSQD